MQNKKVLTIIGVGGHGSSAYRDLVTNPAYSDYKIHLILGADDCGGHTGELQRVLPYIGINQNTIIPMGDLRANLERFVFDLETDNQVAKAKLDCMNSSYSEDDINEFIQKCIEFCNVFNVGNQVLKEGFIEFCIQYFRAYNSLKLSPESGVHDLKGKHKIGNLFLTYLYQYTGLSQESFFVLLKELGFIPQRVFMHFIANERLTLKGGNLDTGITYNSEAEIDIAQLPISPSTYSLHRTSDDTPIDCEYLATSNPRIIEVLGESEIIVYSTGSVGNLFGQINLLAPILKEHLGLKVWLGNIANTSNEVLFSVLLTYYFGKETLGLDGIVLQMSELDFDSLTIKAPTSNWVEQYRKQGKVFVSINALLQNIRQVFNTNGLAKVINLVVPAMGVTIASDQIEARIPEWSSLTEGQQDAYKTMLELAGIKYITSEVSIFIRFFYALNHLFNFELRIIDRETRYNLIAQFLRVLVLAEKEEPTCEIAMYLEILESELEPIKKIHSFINEVQKSNPEKDLSDLRTFFESIAQELDLPTEIVSVA